MQGLKWPPRAKSVVQRNPQHNHPTLQPKLPPHPEISVLHQQFPNPQYYMSPPLQFLHHLFLNRHLHNNHHFLPIFFNLQILPFLNPNLMHLLTRFHLRHNP